MSSREKRRGRVIVKIQSEREQHKRSRSSSLPKSKKRSIGDMEAAGTSEIRPSTSRDAHRRSQKGSPTKIKRSSRSRNAETSGARPRILSNSPPSSPIRSVSKKPKTKIKSSSKSPKKNLHFRSMVMDEGADSRQLLRQMEEKKSHIEKKYKKLQAELLKEQEQTKILLEANQKLEKSAMKDKETHCEEKISMEKELNKLKKRLEKSELDLTMAKSLQTSGGSDQNGGEAFFQDVMGNLQDFLDNQLQCTICSEVYVVATVINCGHTFCEECIEVWKTKQSNGSTCPICRKEIIMTSTNQALDACIERFIDNFYPEAAKVTRTELVSERTAKKEVRIANQGKKENKPAGQHRHRILLRPGNFSSDEEDNWGNEIPLEPLEQLARLDMSPSRFSMSSISIASTRSFLGSDLDGRDTPPSPELNVTFFSDDSDSTDVDYEPRANDITIELGGSDSDASTQFSLSNASEYPETPDNNSTDDENDSVAVNNESDDEDDDESDIARFSDSDSD